MMWYDQPCDLVLFHRSSEGKFLSFAPLDLGHNKRRPVWYSDAWCTYTHMCEELMLFFRTRALFLDKSVRVAKSVRDAGKSTKGTEDEFLAEKVFSSKDLYTAYPLHPSLQHKIVSVMREHDIMQCEFAKLAADIDEVDDDYGIDAASLLVKEMKKLLKKGSWMPPPIAIEVDPSLDEPGNSVLYARYGKLQFRDADHPPPPPESEDEEGEDSEGESSASILDAILDGPDYEGLDNDVAILRETFKICKSEASEAASPSSLPPLVPCCLGPATKKAKK